MLVVSGLAWFIIRELIAQIGDEPATVARFAGEVSVEISTPNCSSEKVIRPASLQP